MADGTKREGIFRNNVFYGENSPEDLAGLEAGRDRTE